MKLSSYDVAKDPFVGNRNFQAFGEFESTHEFEFGREVLIVKNRVVDEEIVLVRYYPNYKTTLAWIRI